MRVWVIAIVGYLIALPGFAQVGNEWIHFGQPYFKIQVAHDSLYRLTPAALQSAGFPAGIDPRTFRLFHRGVEVAIHVEGETDGRFDASDYIEFYGHHNDGTLDTELYNDPSSQPHTLYNLYSDATAYFLTYDFDNGKRMPFSAPSNPGLSPQAYHFDEKLLVLKDQYSAGVDYGDIMASTFDMGEGWMGGQIIQGQTGSYQLEGITNTVTAAGEPSVEILLTGRGPMNHNVGIYAGARLLTTVTFPAYQSYKHTQQLLWSDITADGKVTISAKVAGSPDRISVGYIRLRYPQQTDMALVADKIFTLAPNAGGTAYVEIKNPAPGTRLYDITDPLNVRRIFTTQPGATLNAVINSAGVSRKVWATSATFTPPVKRVTFRSINPSLQNFVIISHPLLRKPASGYTDPVKAYAEYRALPQGGQHDTLIVNIDQLYDQFSYGETSPLAIYHFLKFLKTGKLPDYLFLIGKGLDVNTGYYRNPAPFTAHKDLVPTGGYPGSDMVYSAGLAEGTPAAAVATGRLSAMGPEDVAAYLNKVKETEALPYDNLRRKNVLHLSGGIFPGEPQQFRTFLQQFGTIASALYLGGKVKAIAKQSTDIEVINVADEVNSGLNLITFFGHSAANQSDFDIGYATDPVMGYNNKGKYPVLLMNGCSAGSFFMNVTNFGENWVNSSNRGAIGMIAHSSFGFASSLRNYSSLFYQVGYADLQFMNKGVGDIQKEVARRFHTMYGTEPEPTTQTQQMILLGDPAVKLFGAPKPDYEISTENISINSLDGEPVTALSGSFVLNFMVSNYGNVKNEDFSITVSRTLGNGNIVTYDSTFRAIYYQDTVSFTIPGNVEGGFGNNIFTIEVDAAHAIDELREDNNTASATFFIPLNGTKNLYPSNYAIVNTREVNLSLQHTDMLSGEREFLLEVDTTDTFSSGFKQQYTLRGTVLATRKINLLPNDTLAYYWRTKLANELPNESKEWDVNSFTYIADGPEGWAQVHFPQYGANPSAGLVKDPLLRRLQFEETTSDIAIKTFSATAGKPIDSVSFRINGAEYNLQQDAGIGNFACRNNTINLVAFDKKTTQAYPGIFLTWYEIQNSYGGRRLICGREPYVINSFMPAELVTGNNADLIRYVDNIPAGDSVVLFNMGDAGYASWPAAAKTKLGELGIAVEQIDALQPGEPVVIRARKGTAPGSAKVYRDLTNPPNQQRVKHTGTITGRLSSGTLRTAVIGPAQAWSQFTVRYTEAGPSDQVLFDITGIKLDGREVLLMENVTGDRSLTQIDAHEYPYIRIALKLEDNTFLTAAQLDHWLVTYEPVAEGLLLYRGSVAQQLLFEGQQWDGHYSFINISNYAFHDSLTVNYNVVNAETFAARRKVMKIGAPAPGDTTRFTVTFNTAGQQGLNNAEVFVNPRVVAEQSYDNNFIVLRKHFDITADTEAPVLDVTFDGRHIYRNEFVSPSPDIRIRLRDSNPFMLKKDTLGMAIFLSSPCQGEDCALKAVHFSQPDVRWQAETDTSDFIVHFTPADLQNGTYVLRVEGRDVKGNPSGATPYEIMFQVKTETTVSILPPYPNPFNHKANFSFTVSGRDVPTAFGLQILSLTGQVVNQFSAADAGTFHIGTNTIAWPALDLSGNPLPNGVYVFRLTLRVHDQEVSSQGKIVLVR